MKKRKFLLSVLGLSMLTAVSATSLGASGQLNYCVGASPETFDPRVSTAETTLIPLSQIFETLVDFNYETQKLEPVLATSWNVSKDGLTYTFNLRKNVKWQSNEYFKPTRNFNADDVVYSIKSQLDENSTYRTTGNDKWSTMLGWKTAVADVKKVDDNTVQFVLTAPRSTFLIELVMYQDRIQSKEYADTLLKNGKDLNEYLAKYPIGTGAYQYADFQKDSFIRMTSFNDYWGGKPKIDRVNFAITTDHNVVLSKLEKGECDYSEQVSLTDVLTVKGLQKKGEAKNIVPIATPIGSISGIAINTQKITDPKIREAISYALDYDKIMSVAFHGIARRANTSVPSIIPGHANNIPAKKRDIEKAKKLLAEAGVKPGTLKYTFWYRPNNADGIPLSEIIQADLKEIGIAVEPVTYEWGAFLKKVYAGEADMVDKRWIADIPDASNFLLTQYSCEGVGHNNAAMYCNEKFDELNKKALTTTNVKERNKYFEDAQKIFNIDDVANIPLAEPVKYNFGNSARLTDASLKSKYANPYIKDFELKK